MFATNAGTFGELRRSGRVQRLFSELNDIDLTGVFNDALIEIGVACPYRSTAALPRQQRVDAGYGNRGNTFLAQARWPRVWAFVLADLPRRFVSPQGKRALRRQRAVIGALQRLWQNR